MRLLVVLLAINEAFSYYHKDVGIPEATRIKRLEETLHRVTGGELTDLGAYPFFAGLLIAVNVNSTSVCGSSLISNTKLITAAHCSFDGESYALTFEVVLGSTSLFTGGTRIRTSNVVTHEQYDFETVLNDIAIITIPSIEFTQNIRLIHMPDDKSYPGYQCQIVGFGRTSDESAVTITQQLMDVSTTVISNAECSRMYGELITDSHICTSGSGRGGPCGGDSGGPVFVKSGEFILIGVVSFGSTRGCEAGDPATHTRVSAFLQWIANKM